MLDWLGCLAYMQHLTELTSKTAPNHSNIITAAEQNEESVLSINSKLVSL